MFTILVINIETNYQILIAEQIATYIYSDTGAGRKIIEGANIHIFVFTDCKNNRFQKKLSRMRIYEYSPHPPIIVLAAPLYSDHIQLQAGRYFCDPDKL